MVEGKSHLVYRNLDIRDILNLSVEKIVRNLIHSQEHEAQFFLF